MARDQPPIDAQATSQSSYDRTLTSNRCPSLGFVGIGRPAIRPCIRDRRLSPLF